MNVVAPSSSYPAAFHQALHRGNPGDIDFYQRVCSGASTALEFGSGSGRITHALANVVDLAVGLERDSGFIDIAKSAPNATDHVKFLNGDMRYVADLGTFDRVICPYNGMYCLLTADDWRLTFQSAARCLAPAGLFVFDGYNADDFHVSLDEARWNDGQREFVDRVTVESVEYDVYEQSSWARTDQRIEVTYVYEGRPNGEVHSFALPQRYVLSTQIEVLCEQAGLELIALMGDFDQSSHETDSNKLVVVAAKPGDAD